ncbi:MAG: hypothetical protein ACTSXT_01410 [Candidatus Helarchaeota archaeon]
MAESKKKYKFEGIGLSTAEKRKAKKRFEAYIDNYHIENLADYQLIEELVFRESLQERYKKQIGKLAKKSEKEELVPKHILNTLDDNLQNIVTLKEKLGLFDDKNKKDEVVEVLERLKKKMQIYAETHRAKCLFKCPSCGEYALLLKKIDDYNTFNFNLLRGTFVYNEQLMEEIEKGNLSIDRVAKILGCSSDYVKGCYEKIYLKEKEQSNR